jgi:hypothetical protein
MSAPCAVCNRRYPGLGPDGNIGRVCGPCLIGATRNKDQDYDEEKDQAQVTLTEPPTPTPSGTPGPGDGPEIYQLEAAYKAGELEPEDIELGPMPSWLGKTARAIAEDMRRLMGLRLSVGEDRPLPYAVSFAMARGLVADRRAASRALRQLVRAGVVIEGEPLAPLKPGNAGTKTYGPPVGAVVAFPERKEAA